MARKKRSTVPRVRIRPARRGEAPAIRRLIALYPEALAQRDLPRAPSFFVAETGGRIVGCCALEIYSRRLAEVRSLAVEPVMKNFGIGRKLVEACARRARERRVKELLAVTSETGFFEGLGFTTFRKEKTALFYDVPRD